VRKATRTLVAEAQAPAADAGVAIRELRKLNLARSSKNKIHISEIEIGFGIGPFTRICSDNRIVASRHGIGARNINASGT